MTRPHLARRGDRRGVTLVMVMLLVCIMMLAITGALLRTNAERRNAMDGAAQVDAFAIAMDGIDRYLTGVTTLPSVLPDSQVFTVAGGRAVVTLRPVRLATTDTLLILVSRGEQTSGNRYASDAAVATRTVTQLVRWGSGKLKLPAAFVSLRGFDKNGAAGSISGVDACATAPAPLASIPGLAVPSVSTTILTPDYTGPLGVIDGSPDNQPVALGTPGPTGTAKDSIAIDWAGIRARTAITPTFYYKTTSPISGHWPASSELTGSHWPITFVEGDLSLPSDGQGILIVTGDLTISGSDQWDGLVLVGGTITSNGNNNIAGGLFTGLNVLIGTVVPRQSVGNGTKTFQYNSCAVSKALGALGGWNRLGNARTDNYPSY